jgi:CSLREA domain-containing protein
VSSKERLTTILGGLLVISIWAVAFLVFTRSSGQLVSPALPTEAALPTLAPMTIPIVAARQPTEIPVIENRIIVHFTPDSTQAEREAYVKSLGGTIDRQLEPLNAAVLTLPDAAPLPPSPVIAASEPDYLVTALLDVPTSDPHYSEQWGLSVIGAPDAWLALPDDALPVRVAVIDSGICAAHPDLAGRVLAGYDFVDEDAVPEDAFGHGCAVSGVIAANIDNGEGIAGVAPNAQVMPLRVLDGQGIGTYSDVAAAMIYAADAGAQVINLSLGGPNSSSLLADAVRYTVERDVLVIAAAGNTGREGVLYPAAYDGVIAVGAIDPDLQRSSFSTYGPQIALLAPGRGIMTTQRDGTYAALNGTSMAAPYASGAAAILIARGESLELNGGILSLGESAATPPTPLPVEIPAQYQALHNKAIAEGRVRVIVGLSAAYQSESQLTSAQAQAQRLDIAQAQQALLANLSAYSVEILSQSNYWTIPALGLSVDRAGLEYLINSPEVTYIYEDRPVPPALVNSVPKIDAPEAWAQGFDGTGQAVAILDTGVDYEHEMLDGGRVAGEACFSTSIPSLSISSICPGGVDTLPGINDPGAGMPTAACLQSEDCYHGTHVAGIALGRDGSHPSAPDGVAPGASIIPIQVFSRFDGSICMEEFGVPAPCLLSFITDQVSALNHLKLIYSDLQNAGVNLASVNMSLGSGSDTTFCDADEPETAALIDELFDLGVATIAASGNGAMRTGSYVDGISAPACIENAVSVGSTVTSTDSVSSFSQSAPILDLLAPGQPIVSAYVDTFNWYATSSGTSMAAPHVAGAWAILKQAKPNATVTEILDAFSTTGVPVLDTRGGINRTKPRIDVDNALTALLPPLIVNSTNDSSDGVCDAGHCSLREAITIANSTANTTEQIRFNIGGGGQQTIALGANPLPSITSPVIIDGTTQPGYSGTPLIEIDGANVTQIDPLLEIGLNVLAGNSTVRGLVINNFGSAAINLSLGNGSIITGNYLGTEPNGTTAAPNREGVRICSSSNNRVGGTTSAERNVISGNSDDGINICQLPGFAVSANNIIQGNYIGLTATGNAVLGNSDDGIKVENALNTLIGGTTNGARNVISGNGFRGILLVGGGSHVIQGNYIGSNAAGTQGFTSPPSNSSGIWMNSSNNLIGGTTSGARNVISGNDHSAILLYGSSSNNTIQGNFIGTTATGNAAMPNQNQGGIVFNEDANNNLVGGTTSGAGNVISGNHTGIDISADNNTVQGNFIGTDLSATLDLGNYMAGGIFVEGNDNLIGGTAAGAGNVIAYNTWLGVTVAAVGFDFEGNAILGNRIFGTKVGPEPNSTGLGIDLALDGVTANDTGDSDDGNNNLQNFPVITSAEGTLNTLVVDGTLNSTPNTTFRVELFANDACDPSGYGEGQFFLGAQDVTTDGSGDATFTAQVSSGFSIGQQITATATDPNNNTSEFSECFPVTLDPDILVVNTTSATNDGVCNTHCSLADAIVVANGMGGQQTVVFNIPGGAPYTIRPTAILPSFGDLILDATTQPGYAGSPIVVLDGSLITQSGTDGLRANSNTVIRGFVIHSFRRNGITLIGNNNVVEGNYLGTDVTGMQARPNLNHGIDAAGHDNLIGGTTAAARNLISGNGASGIFIGGHATNSFANTVQGNYIGTTISGTAALANGQYGIYIGHADNIIGGAAGTTPGGPCTGACNLISGNGRDGIFIRDTTANPGVEADNNTIQGNYIGMNAAGTAAIPNSESGIHLNTDTKSNLIGGPSTGEGNLISGNAQHGIEISGDSETRANTVQGNLIGTNAAGTARIPNGLNGILIASAVNNNVIGGPNAGEGNLISGNNASGISISGLNTDNNRIAGNRIGTDISGMMAVPNTGYGIQIVNGPDENILISNLISGNSSSGVYIADSASEDNQVTQNFIGLNVDGSAALPNNLNGIEVVSGVQTELFDNHIAGNTGSGIVLTGATNTFIHSNTVGLESLGNGQHGIWIKSGTGTLVGGFDETGQSAFANTIAFNAGDGVFVEGGSGHEIFDNFIYTNGGLGIDLGPNGVTLNDNGDGDSGANGLLNFPVVNEVVATISDVRVEGIFNGQANATYWLDFYNSDACDASGHGEGQRYLGADSVTTGAGGSGTFQVVLPRVVESNTFITVTAIDALSNTSEFSACTEAILYVPTPQDFTVQVLSEIDIQLSWTDRSIDETHWLVERSLAGQNQWTQIASLPTADDEGMGAAVVHHDTAFLCSKSYDYRMRAQNESGGYYSLYTPAQTGAPACPLLNAPDGFGLTAAQHQIDLNWTDTNTTETGYRIDYSSSAGQTWTLLATAPANATAYSQTGLICGTTHTFRVSAVRDHDSAISGYTPVETTTTTACPPLTAPDIPAASALSRSTIQFTWADSATGQTTAFHLERSANGVDWTQFAVVPAGVTSVVDSNLNCGQNYQYRARGFRLEDNAFSPYSGVASATTSGCPTPVNHTVGIYKNGVWHFWQTTQASQPLIAFSFGPQESGWTPVIGDWDGDGVDGIGVYKNGLWLLRGTSGSGSVDLALPFGPAEPGWQPIVGDWNGDGVDGIGVYKNGVWLLRQTPTQGQPDITFNFGPAEPGWKAIAGDWDGGGTATIGLFKDGLWLLSNRLPAAADVPPFAFGQTGWIPVVGDWDQDSRETAGLYKDGMWHLRNVHSGGAPDAVLGLSIGSGWQPVSIYEGGMSGLTILSMPPDVQPTTPAATTPVTPDAPTATAVPEITEEPTAEATEAVLPTSTPEPSPTEMPSVTPELETPEPGAPDGAEATEAVEG